MPPHQLVLFGDFRIPLISAFKQNTEEAEALQQNKFFRTLLL